MLISASFAGLKGKLFSGNKINMKIKSLTVITGLLLMALPLSCQEISTDQSLNFQSEKVLSPERLEKMFEKPAALSGYKPLQSGPLRNYRYSDSLVQLARPLWRESFGAWASNDPQVHEKVNQKIHKYRESFDRGLIPFPKEEMDTIPEFEDLLPTWNSLQYDYLTEMKHFNKKWLALFGAEDQVVPTEASVKNILHYMSVSGNEDYTIAIIPNCGHAPVDTKTGQRILFENIILNWMNENVLSD